MGILTRKIKDYNTMGKKVTDPKASVNKALDTYSEMKTALPKAVEKKRKAEKPKVFKVDIKEEPKKEAMQSSINMFGTSTVVTDLNEIGIGTKSVSRKQEDREIDFASVNRGLPAFQLKEVDHSNLYKVEASNVLNLNPFQVSFSESELDQYTYQNPMIIRPDDGFTKQSF